MRDEEFQFPPLASNWWDELGHGGVEVGHPQPLLTYKPMFFVNHIESQKEMGSQGEGAIAGMQFGPLQLSASGMQTEYGDQSNFGGAINMSDLIKMQLDRKRSNIIASIGADYDMKSKTATPRVTFGYGNMTEEQGGYNFTVSMDSRMTPQYQAEYKMRF